ncbi:protease inhibitor I42 family protein [Streptomyces oryzae]|uniref:Protease inhibitor I42 family protein n=1 Tax=Streptomyces oryzae TaxID=1434886 RepID=A0ABS3X4Y6_9ACTN|nr:protease inhibitor I42 family protein [Streptomyces oryzae]MBO8190438.1 protease inhibitor I42 family protein [Streptomyces oryzae]
MKPATLAVAVLLAVSACGGGDGNANGAGGNGGGNGNGSDDGGTGVPRPREFGPHETRVRVRPHEQFVLKVPYRPGEGYRWIVRGQRPDPETVTLIDTRNQDLDPDRPGDTGERWYSYRAEQPGSTELRLRECFQCGTERQVVDEDHRVTDVTFRVTVTR